MITLSRPSSSSPQSFPTSTRVSVVVTTKNEEKNIASCLRSIKSQTWADLEIIVVDNYSSDRTKEIAREFTSLVFDKGPERSAQRNFGMIEAAKGDFVLYVDADMILSPDLVERCVKRIAERNCVALHISEVILGRSFWCRVRRFERAFYDGTSVDGARFFSRDVFREVGGFDEKINAAEDWDVDKKIKRLGPIAFLSPKFQGGVNLSVESESSTFMAAYGVDPVECGTVIYHNEANFRLSRYLKKKNYYAADFSAYISRWGKNDPDIRRQFGFWYRYIGVFIEDGKWKRLLRHPVLTMGMYFLRFLVGVVYLTHRFKNAWGRPK